MGDNSGAGRRRVLRFAEPSRLAASILTCVTLAACAGARPTIELPAPRSAPVELESLGTAAVEPARPPAPTSVVWGEVRFAARGGPALDLGPAVVYLRPRGRPTPIDDEPSTVRIVSSSPEFAPPLMVVHPAQGIVFVNEGPLVHRLFSPDVQDASFELEPGGRSQRFWLRARGPTRFYCSLHAEEAFVVFVEDASNVAVVSEDGAYRFTGVAPGRYALEIWSERVAGRVRDVVVDGYTRTRQPIWLFANLIEP